MAKRSMHNLYIMKILLDKTNQDYPLTSKGIIDELSCYGITIERKTVYQVIDTLKTFGVDIKQSKAHPRGYYVASREFEIPEIKLLLDAVQSSKFITSKKSMELIEKIKQLTDKYSAQKLQREIHIANRVKAENETIYYNIDKIHLAIADKKKISFQYSQYALNKELVLRKNGKRYKYSPIALIWDDEYYYLVVYDSERDYYVHFRTDKMKNIEILEEAAIKSKNSMNIGKYAKQVFSMFGGDIENVTLRVDNALIGVIIDKFGKEITIRRDEDSFNVTVQVAVSSSFYGWLFQFSNKVKILSPEHVAEKYREQLTIAMKTYD